MGLAPATMPGTSPRLFLASSRYLKPGVHESGPLAVVFSRLRTRLSDVLVCHDRKRQYNLDKRQQMESKLILR